MAFTVGYSEQDGGGTFKPVAEGTHVAVCSGVVDLGTTYSEKFSKWSRKAAVMFQVDGGQITKTVTVSLHPKAMLRGMLESWFGKKMSEDAAKNFDLFKLVGKGCQILVTHSQSNGRTYANIQTIMPLAKGMKAPDIDGDAITFSFEDDQVTIAKAGLPQWLQNRIEQSKEWADLKGKMEAPADEPTGADASDDEDIAF